MTDGDTRVEGWKAIPAYPNYQASNFGRIRSVPRTEHGRTYPGVVMSSRVSNSGYVLVDVRTAAGEKKTRTAHALVLEAFVGPCPPGMESRHLNGDPLDNRLGNLMWGTKAENESDKVRHGTRIPAKPVPPKTCVRCGAEYRGNGRRCHPCVVEIGEEGARLLTAGVDLDEACDRLGYPSASGLHKLARRYGGYGQSPAPAVTDSDTHPVTQRSWWRRLWRSRTVTGG